MIQKCPHCKSNVIFSRNICPACGYEVPEGDRLESDYIGDQAKLGIVPAYTRAMEETLNETQKRGRLLVGLIIGLLLSPQIVLTCVSFFWLRPSLWGVLVLIVTVWLCRRLWLGVAWCRPGLGILAGISGFSGLVLLVFGHAGLNPVARLVCGVFGLVYLWCSYQLLASLEIPEFLRVQRMSSRD